MNGLNIAKKKAHTSTFERARHGAVITKGGRVLSSATNKTKRSKHAARNQYESIHAEEAAIFQLLRQPNGLQHLAGATIFITRVLKNGTTANSTPCPSCAKLIQSVGIKKIIHT